MPTDFTILNDIPEQIAVIKCLDNVRWSRTDNNQLMLHKTKGSLREYIKQYGYLDYFQGLQLILDLGSQIVSLANLEKGILTLNSDDITVCNSFVINAFSNLNILENNELIVQHPIIPASTNAPELDTITTLPSKISISALYYNIALICIESLGINREMREIKGTKLYYMLERCLRHDPKRREFLLI